MRRHKAVDSTALRQDPAVGALHRPGPVEALLQQIATFTTMLNTIR